MDPCSSSLARHTEVATERVMGREREVSIALNVRGGQPAGSTQGFCERHQGEACVCQAPLPAVGSITGKHFEEPRHELSGLVQDPNPPLMVTDGVYLRD